jgi:hypothetical protein
LPVNRGLIVATGLLGTLDGDADLWLGCFGFAGLCARAEAVAFGKLG